MLLRQNEKIFISGLMWTAMVFGFMDKLFPDIQILHFNRLHIFLFNLCSGGSIVYASTIKKPIFSKKSLEFTIISIIFAIFASLQIYSISIFCAFYLSFLVENSRIKKFKFFPYIFFDKKADVSEKFHNASLLCLSMGLSISALVMINNCYLHLVIMKKLQLDTFFLGFSFPLSLITMSVMFKVTGDDKKQITRVLKNIGFWGVNLGVITFFCFIIFEQLYLQLAIAISLFIIVLLIFYIFISHKKGKQEKTFLVSGMSFLIFTGITGIFYIILEMSSFYNKDIAHIILRMHSFASLYGWNLIGLGVITRFNDFPLQLNSTGFIFLHWITIIIFAPLGHISNFMALSAIISYAFILKWIFFSTRTK